MDSPKVLILDDESAIRIETKRELKRFLYNSTKVEFFEAGNLQEARSIVTENNIWVVFLDVMLQATKENGLDFVSFLRQESNNSSIQIILRTGQAEDVPQNEVFEKYDICNYLDKIDISSERLETTLRSGLKLYEKCFYQEELIKQGIEKNKKMQQQMFHSEKLAAIGTLSTGIAHEIGNAMNGISGGEAILLKEIQKMRDIGSSDLIRLEESASRISKGKSLIQYIVNSMSASTRKDSMYIHKFMLRDTIIGAFTLCSKKISNSSVKALCEGVPANLQIKSNESVLIRAIMNLIGNSCDAIKSYGKGSQIEISVKEEKDSLILSYTDNGPGVPKNIEKKIFEEFFTTKEPGKGTGLGMYMAKTELEHVKSNLGFDPEYSGGAKFTISFLEWGYVENSQESIDQPVKDLSKSRESNNKSERPTMLVVDDNTNLKDSWELLLRDEFNLQFFESAEEGLTAISKLKPEIILLDLELPGLPVNFSADFLSRFPELNVYIQSGHTYQTAREELGLGIRKDRYIEKMAGDFEFQRFIKPWSGKEINYWETYQNEEALPKKPNSLIVESPSFWERSPLIVYIDDEADNIDTFIEHCPNNWAVLGFDKTADAAQRIFQINPNFLITDQKMPGIKGLDLASSLNTLNILQHIFICSAFDLSEIKVSEEFDSLNITKEVPKFTFLPKPISSKSIEQIQNIADLFSPRELKSKVDKNGYFKLDPDAITRLCQVCYRTNLKEDPRNKYKL